MANAGRILILAKGAWESLTNYVQLDLVTRNGIAYIARRASVGVDPALDVSYTNWMPFGSAAEIATTVSPGLVMPDGTSITVSNTGLISAVLGIEDLTDVDIENPLTNQVLRYNGTSWEAKTLGAAADKATTNAVTQGSTALVESGAVYNETSTLSTQIQTLTNQVASISHTSVSILAGMDAIKTYLLDSISDLEAGDVKLVGLGNSTHDMDDVMNWYSGYEGYLYYETSNPVTFFYVAYDTLGDDLYISYRAGAWEFASTTKKVGYIEDKVSNSSDEYSSSVAYSVNDYVIHENKLYRCITACSAAAWSVNSSCFTQDTITNALGDLAHADSLQNISYTGVTGWTPTTVSAKHRGNIGSIRTQASLSIISADVGAWHHVLTLNEGRPWQILYLEPFDGNTGEPSTTFTARIDTDGKMYILAHSPGTYLMVFEGIWMIG